MNFPKLTLTLPGYGSRIDPVRDWLIVIIVAGLLLLGTLALHTWLFLEITRVDQSPRMEPAAADTSAELLQQTRQVFTERAQEALRYRSFEFVDPSR